MNKNSKYTIYLVVNRHGIIDAVLDHLCEKKTLLTLFCIKDHFQNIIALYLKKTAAFERSKNSEEYLQSPFDDITKMRPFEGQKRTPSGFTFT